jgi:hypothetical protein
MSGVFGDSAALPIPVGIWEGALREWAQEEQNRLSG